MPETLLSPSNILLYGRVMEDLKFTFVDPNAKGANCDVAPPQRLGANNFLEAQLQAGAGDPEREPRLARIYAFSFEGHYFDLAKPAIFIVHGPGADPEEPRPGANPPDSRVSRAPADADRTGVAGQTGSYSDDLKVWTYDQGDFSIRFDVETGPFEEILLEAELSAEDIQSHFSGQRVRSSGQRVRSSGQRVRYSGQRVRGPDD